MTTDATPTPATAPPSASTSDTAVLARRLLPLARMAFQGVRQDDRTPILYAIDAFLLTPTPATFLSATRVMDETLRRLLIARAGRGPLQRGFAEGVQTLRTVGVLPATVIDELEANLPVDPRAAERLNALAALVTTYTALGTRVVADADQRRRQWKSFPRRRPPK